MSIILFISFLNNLGGVIKEKEDGVKRAKTG